MQMYEDSNDESQTVQCPIGNQLDIEAKITKKSFRAVSILMQCGFRVKE